MILKVTLNVPGQPSVDVDFDHCPMLNEKIVLKPGIDGGPTMKFAIQAVTTNFTSSPIGWSQDSIVVDLA